MGRLTGEDNCAHGLEAHVLYDATIERYRGELRCRCAVRRIASTEERTAYVDAEADAKRMITLREGSRR